MIEIELFHRNPAIKNQCMKIWVKGNLVYEYEITTHQELIDLRNAIHNELLWLNRYLEKQGITEE